MFLQRMEHNNKFSKYILNWAFSLSIKKKCTVEGRNKYATCKCTEFRMAECLIWHLSSLMSKHLLTHLWLCHLWFISLLNPEDKCHIKPQLSRNLAALTSNVHAFTDLSSYLPLFKHDATVTEFFTNASKFA